MKRPGAFAILALVLGAAELSHVPSLLALSPTSGAASASSSSPLAGPYLKWLNEDVRWIITRQERSAYMALPTDAERLQFIQQFWDRRNPDPGSKENKFKEEHYRRLAYANVHFASGSPGWMSDRGHVYIVYGPPDSIDAHRLSADRGAQGFQVWHYNVLHSEAGNDARSAASGQGSPMRDVDVKFVDSCDCGDYKLASHIP